MKGRRRARRVALQALYELDLTRHALQDVLAARVANLYAAAAPAPAAAEAPSDRALYDRLVELVGTGETVDADVAGLAVELGVEPERVSAQRAYVQRVRQQAVFMSAVVEGVKEHQAELDRVIARIAPEWPVEQMAPVDRNLLRIALWEIASHATPVRVAISEAVELARQFSGEGARRMVNGALGAYASSGHDLCFDPPVEPPQPIGEVPS